jgi:DNA-binding transcriptional ArsR family regulator
MLLSLAAHLMGKHSLAYASYVADVYRALDDETRRLILDELATRDGRSLFEICTALTMHHCIGSTRQAISQHLNVLEGAGLVTTERRGRTKLHFFNPEPLEAITRRWPTTRKDAR